MNEIKLHNTLTGQKEIFEPIAAGQVSIYSCGPTVYDFAHIGNFRSFLLSDLLHRVIEYAGYKVTRVQNITDVGHLTDDDLADSDGEDKILKKARVENKDPFEIARAFENYFLADEKHLKVRPPEHRPRATDFIPEQIKITEDLIKKGFAYESNGSVYFRTSEFKDYGVLSKNNLEDLVAGARVEVNSEKENPLDFALWKHADPSHLMQWESPWGQGFPGWHIECTAMSQALLGTHFDIHTGGEDNIFPHHECELAQNEASTGHKSVNYWLHTKHLLVDNQKMSKSKGNFYTVRDLLAKNWTGVEIRYALISAHYRTALNFTESSLTQARSSIKRLQEALNVLNPDIPEANDIDWVKQAREKYKKALFDDLNAAEALGVTFELVGAMFKKRESGALTEAESSAVYAFLVQDFNQIFEVLETETSEIPQEVADLLVAREKARTEKNFSDSDRIRDEISALGYQVLDEAGGQRLEKI